MKIVNAIKAFLTAIAIMIAGMFGGQKEKGARRFGIPGIAILASLGKNFRLKHLAFLLFIPILICGYGENSFLMGIFHNDTLVRFAYGFMLSIPFIFFGISRWVWALILLVSAFQVRAGSLGQIWGMDILIEDMMRYLTLGILVTANIFFE